MNGLSLIFAVVVILTLVVIAGVIVFALVGSTRMLSRAQFRRGKSRTVPITHHRG